MALATTSLHKRGADLSDPLVQLKVLNTQDDVDHQLPAFSEKLKETGLFPLRPTGLEVFQVNVGYMCNQVCQHCHVDAGPDRKEIMTRETMQDCLDALARTDVGLVDLTKRTLSELSLDLVVIPDGGHCGLLGGVVLRHGG